MTRRLGTALLAAALAALASGPGQGAPEDFQLTAGAADFADYYPTYLANGYFSTFSSIRGTDANVGYMLGLMDYTPGDVSRPAAIPGWTGIDYYDSAHWLNQSPVTAQSLREYRQTLDLYDGLLTTRYQWADGARTTRVVVRTFVSQVTRGTAASELEITPDFDGSVRLAFDLRSWPPPTHRLPLARLDSQQLQAALHASTQSLRAVPPATPDRAAIWYPGELKVDHAHSDTQRASVWLSGHAHGGLEMAEAFSVSLPEKAASGAVHLSTSPDHLTLYVDLTVHRGTRYRFGKFVTLWRQGWEGTAAQVSSRAEAARTAGFAALLRAHVQAWHELWRSDVQVTGDSRVQRAIHSDLFYLLQNSTVDTGWAMSACGPSPHYAGHVFWDSDSWAFPALLLLHPERARSLVMFRYRTLDEAKQRARAHGLRGAMYPWESDPERGTDQTPFFAGPLSEREIHVNADIAIAQWQYFLASGDLDWLRRYGWPVIQAVAEFWESRVTERHEPHRFEILHVTSPDEDYRDVPNDAFTNAAARKALQIASLAAQNLGLTPDPRWRSIADGLYLPFSSSGQRHLDFDPSVPHNHRTWMGSALAWLAYPPLDTPMSATVRRHDFDFALDALERQGNDPNDMLIVMLSIEAAELGDVNAAYAWLQRNLDGFVKPPFNVRSETAENNVGYLLSTSGGFVQNFVFGFPGLRPADAGLPQRYPPVLPPAWGTVTLKNLTWRGDHFNIIVSREPSSRTVLRRVATSDR